MYGVLWCHDIDATSLAMKTLCQLSVLNLDLIHILFKPNMFSENVTSFERNGAPGLSK